MPPFSDGTEKGVNLLWWAPLNGFLLSLFHFKIEAVNDPKRNFFTHALDNAQNFGHD
jgi:hypothetical protein